MLIKNNLYLYFIVQFFHRVLREKKVVCGGGGA
jgi:hypothetical protein